MEIAAFILLTLFSFLITSVGNFLGLESGFVTMTTFYFLLTVVPAFAFAVCYTVMLATDKSKGNKKSRGAKVK